MVDAIDLLFVEMAVQEIGELLGGRQILAERFFDDHARPSRRLRQTDRVEAFHHARHRSRRQRQIERVVFR
jgi:hypothetical protein